MKKSKVCISVLSNWLLWPSLNVLIYCGANATLTVNITDYAQRVFTQMCSCILCLYKCNCAEHSVLLEQNASSRKLLLPNVNVTVTVTTCYWYCDYYLPAATSTLDWLFSLLDLYIHTTVRTSFVYLIVLTKPGGGLESNPTHLRLPRPACVLTVVQPALHHLLVSYQLLFISIGPFS